MPKIGNANREDLIISTNHMDLKQKPKSAKIMPHFSGLYKVKPKHKPVQKPYTIRSGETTARRVNEAKHKFVK